MDMIKKIFPYSFGAKDAIGLVIKIVVYLVVGAVADGDGTVIGMGAIVLTGAVLGDGCLVGAGALVTGKTVAPAGSMLLGSPAKVIKELTPEQIETQIHDAQHYVALAKEQFTD